MKNNILIACTVVTAVAAVAFMVALIVVAVTKKRSSSSTSSSVSSSFSVPTCTQTKCLPVSYNDTPTPYYISSPLKDGFLHVNNMDVEYTDTGSPLDFVGSISFDGDRGVYEIMSGNLGAFITIDGETLINAVPSPISSKESWNVYRLGNGMADNGGEYSIVNLVYQKAISISSSGQITLTDYDPMNPTLQQRLFIVPVS